MYDLSQSESCYNNFGARSQFPVESHHNKTCDCNRLRRFYYAISNFIHILLINLSIIISFNCLIVHSLL